MPPCTVYNFLLLTIYLIYLRAYRKQNASYRDKRKSTKAQNTKKDNRMKNDSSWGT